MKKELRREFEELQNTSDYELELEKVIAVIKKEKAKLVLLQFPDGLKKIAHEVAAFLESATGSTCIVWGGSCYGACDLPPVAELEKLGITLVVQFGHSAWPYSRKDIKVLKF